MMRGDRRPLQYNKPVIRDVLPGAIENINARRERKDATPGVDERGSTSIISRGEVVGVAGAPYASSPKIFFSEKAQKLTFLVGQ